MSDKKDLKDRLNQYAQETSTKKRRAASKDLTKAKRELKGLKKSGEASEEDHKNVYQQRKIVKKLKKEDPKLLRNRAKNGAKFAVKQQRKKYINKTINQDEDLAAIKENVDKLKDAKFKSNLVKKGAKVTGKVAAKPVKAGYNFANRQKNFIVRGSFTKTPYSRQLWRARKRFNNVRKRIKKPFDVTANFFRLIRRYMGVSRKIAISAIAIPLALMFSLFFIGSAAVAMTPIKQNDQQINDSWLYMSKLDANASDTANHFYSDIEGSMYLMNNKFNDYTLSDGFVWGDGLFVSTNYQGVVDHLWHALNGDAPNYSLTTVDDLASGKGAFKVDNFGDYKNAIKEFGFSTLNNQLQFPYSTSSLTITRRYGYERSGDNVDLHDSSDISVNANQQLNAPMSGVVHKIDDQTISITADKSSRLTIAGIDTSRFSSDTPVKVGDVLGNTKSSSVNMKYEQFEVNKENPEFDGKFYPVNVGFYFPKVVYTQYTTLANSNFNPSGQQLENAKEIYKELSEQGYTTAGIAAALGNWTVESSINPKRAEGDYLPAPIGPTDDSSWDNSDWLSMTGPQIYDGKFPNIELRGLGLGQWTNGRHQLLIDFANNKQKKWYDLSLQIDFMLNGDTPGSRSALKQILSSQVASDVPTLTRLFLQNWEGNPGDKLQDRIQAALNWYNYFTKGSASYSKSSQAIIDEYKDRISPMPDDKSTLESQAPGYPGNAYALGNCTYYVYNREAQLGVNINPYMGNGGQWAANFAKTANAHIVDTPKRGDMLSFQYGDGISPLYGHVAFVEYVNDDGSMVISEMNYGGEWKMNFRIVTKQPGMTLIRVGNGL